MTTAEKLVRAFNVTKELRAIARERVGRPPGTKVFTPRPLRRKPKHPKREDDQE